MGGFLEEDAAELATTVGAFLEEDAAELDDGCEGIASPCSGIGHFEDDGCECNP